MEGANSAQHLGLFNFTNNGNPNNRIFAIEFDVFANQEFNDIDDNHVGVDVNSLTSIASHTAGIWGNDDRFKKLDLNNGVNYQVWIDYNSSVMNITMAKVGDLRPRRPLISESVNLSDVFLDEMFVGFTGATGRLVESHKILAWGFSNSNSSIGDGLVTENLPSFVMSNNSIFESVGFIVGMCVGALFVAAMGVLAYFVVARRRKKTKESVELEDWELEYWPHRIGYQEIHAATKGFSEENVIGFGGNGKVYRGVLAGGIQVAVKKISHESEHGLREFLAEVSSLGRLKHRNLVKLQGWCRETTGSLILVYDYMENGSVDKRIFECDESTLLNWDERIKILKDVASGILYLHEGWEAKVLHRDIKSSNVLLDNYMNARLGDFGLARMHNHNQVADTTRVVGTAGYMAPEVVRTGRATIQTDMFGFGVLILEMVCGRRPIEEGMPGLVEYAHRLAERGELSSALDDRVKAKGGYDAEEVKRVVYLGLLCVHPDPSARPTIRQVMKVLENRNGDAASEVEGMEVYMLGGSGTIDGWRNLGSGGSRGHPTFDEIRNNVSSSFSLCNSDIILEGR